MILLLIASVLLSSAVACPDRCDLSDPEHQLYNLYSTLADVMKADMVTECGKVAGDDAQYKAFIDNLVKICADKQLTCEPCECDICDFSGQECFEALPPLMQACLIADCNAVKDDEDAYNALLDNFVDVCSDKNLKPLENPCECDICDFSGQECFEALPPLMQACLIADCRAIKDDEDAYNALLENFVDVCTDKSLKPLENPCYCDICDFYDQECFEALPPLMQQCLIADCRAIEDDMEAYNALLLNFEDVCGDKKLDPLKNPCGNDTCRTDICLMILIDSSDSIVEPAFNEELEFVRDLVSAFGPYLAPDQSRIGLVQFSSHVAERLAMCDGTSQADVEEGIDFISTHKGSLGTLTALGDVLKLIAPGMDACCTEPNRRKFAVLVTDGRLTVGSPLFEGIGSIPDDVTTIAVGFGAASTVDLDDIAGNIPGNSFLGSDSTSIMDFLNNVEQIITNC